jgi:hypothetical protein
MSTLVHAAPTTTEVSARKVVTVMTGVAIMAAIVLAPTPTGLSLARRSGSLLDWIRKDTWLAYPTSRTRLANSFTRD